MKLSSSEVIDFTEVQRVVNLALDTGDLAKAKDTLEGLQEIEERKKSSQENLFIYRSLGKVYSEAAMLDEAKEAFRQAYRFDSRDFDVLQAQAKGLLAAERITKEELPILQRLLVHHKFKLSKAMVAGTYQAMGEFFNKEGDTKRAKYAYEKAVSARPGDMAIIQALLDMAEAEGDDEAVIAVREKLLNNLSNAESRAAVLVAIGDDYKNKLNDNRRALNAYERAIAECSHSVPAIERMVAISAQEGDWHKVVSSLKLLASIVEETADKIKFLQQAAEVAKAKLDSAPMTAEIYEKILDLDPMQLDVFKAIARLYLEVKDWDTLDACYSRMIGRHNALSNPKDNILAVLNRNLGDLRLKQREDIPGAIEAFEAASHAAPQEIKFHITLAELYSRDEKNLAKAVERHRTILRLSPDRIESVDELAVLYRRMEAFDESLLIYRVLDALGRADEEGRSIVARFNSSRVPQIDQVIGEELWKKYIQPDYLDQDLADLFALTQPILLDSFAHDLEHYGLREKTARLDLSQPSFFSKVFQRVVRTHGFNGLPGVYISPDQLGMRNAYLIPPAFLVGEDMLQGREEAEVTFVCAKSMVLFRPEFFLAQFGGRAVLQAVLLSTFKTFRPELKIETNKTTQRISKLIEKKVPTGDKAKLKAIVERFINEEKQPAVPFYLEAAEDAANRVGLLFCDNLPLASRLMAEEQGSISSRAADERFGSLLMWALSDEYAKLRKALDIAIGK